MLSNAKAFSELAPDLQDLLLKEWVASGWEEEEANNYFWTFSSGRWTAYAVTNLWTSSSWANDT